MSYILQFVHWLVLWQWLLLGCGLLVPYLCHTLIHRNDTFDSKEFLLIRIGFWEMVSIVLIAVGVVIITILWIVCLVTIYWVSALATVAIIIYSAIVGNNYIKKFALWNKKKAFIS